MARFKPGPKIPFSTPEELEVLINKYFESCFDKEGKRIRPITLEGLAYDIGCDRRTIWEYKKKPEFWPVIKKAIDMAQMSLAEYAMEARNPAGAIWLGCNNYEYVQKKEVNITTETESLSADDIRMVLENRRKSNGD